MKKLLYVCLDGLGDDPIPAFDGRTPLEAAADAGARRAGPRGGATGVVMTVGEGIAPESDIAVFAILGYDPREEHPGRGVVEAVGIGHGLPRRRPRVPGELRDRRLAATIVDRRVGRDLVVATRRTALADEVQRTLQLPGRHVRRSRRRSSIGARSCSGDRTARCRPR